MEGPWSKERGLDTFHFAFAPPPRPPSPPPLLLLFCQISDFSTLSAAISATRESASCRRCCAGFFVAFLELGLSEIGGFCERREKGIVRREVREIGTREREQRMSGEGCSEGAQKGGEKEGEVGSRTGRCVVLKDEKEWGVFLWRIGLPAVLGVPLHTQVPVSLPDRVVYGVEILGFVGDLLLARFCAVDTLCQAFYLELLVPRGRWNQKFKPHSDGVISFASLVNSCIRCHDLR